MKKSLILLAFVFSFATTWATDFYFTGNEDYDFANAANWSPSFPGTSLAAGDRVFVQSDIYFEDVNWEVAGTIDVSMGASVISNTKGITIQKGGKLINNGEIKIAELQNNGTVENGMTAALTVKSCRNIAGAIFHNMMNAKLNIDKLINEAAFVTNGICAIQVCVNKSEIQVADRAIMDIAVTLETYANSNITKSEKASFTANHTIEGTQGGYMQGMKM